MSQDITVTDLFCGAGGSSIGAEAMGARLKMAANHWSLAIETHATNFPNADHDCADVSQVDPRRYPRTDILLASPECTHHSLARSNKHRPDLFDPTGDAGAERSRATMWDIPRFAERHRYEIVVVENVVEIMRWAPIDGWFLAMERLGYHYRTVSLNSAVAHPTPQSRDRLYVVFWQEGNRAPDLNIRPLAWCASCERDVGAVQTFKKASTRHGKYRTQYLYHCPDCATPATPYAWPASSAIDWTLPTPRIGDRARPLAETTLKRIQVGLERYGPAAIVQAAGHTYERPGYFRTWPITQPIGAQTATAQHALVVETAYTGRGDWGRPGRPVAEPLPTQTARLSHALVVPLRRNGRVRDAAEAPVPAVAAGGNHHGLLVPPAFFVKNFGPADQAGSMVKPVSDPFGTVTTVDHHSVVQMPFTLNYNRTGNPIPVTQPVGAVTCTDRHAVVEPAVEIEDCGFRMLEPHEIGRAMAFPDSYTVLGNKRDRVRQYGNAVTPPAMTELVARCVESLA